MFCSLFINVFYNIKKLFFRMSYSSHLHFYVNGTWLSVCPNAPVSTQKIAHNFHAQINFNIHKQIGLNVHIQIAFNLHTQTASNVYNQITFHAHKQISFNRANKTIITVEKLENIKNWRFSIIYSIIKKQPQYQSFCFKFCFKPTLLII